MLISSSFPLNYQAGKWHLTKLVSSQLDQYKKILLITAGFHGDEPAGPISLRQMLPEIIDRAEKKGIGLIVYPLINPSGFERRSRYNVNNEKPNNDFLRYRLDDGRLIDDLGNSDKFSTWHWSSDLTLKLKLPVETKLLHHLLRSDPLARVVAVIDLHQDNITSSGPLTYHYVFGERQRYNNIIDNIESHVPLAKYRLISAGFNSELPAPKTDGRGFITRHDGSLADLLWRLGVAHAVTVETTTATPLTTAIEINRLWITRLIDIL